MIGVRTGRVWRLAVAWLCLVADVAVADAAGPERLSAHLARGDADPARRHVAGRLPARVARGLGRDLLGLTAPGPLAALATGGALAALARPWDTRVRGWHARQPALRALLAADNVWAESSVLLPVVAGSWAVARIGGQPAAAATATRTLRAVVVASLVVGPVKAMVGRQRPDGTDHRSFPSGHSANAMAVASSVVSGHGPRFGAAVYLSAATVPLARLHANRHYLSDVLAGAAVGTAAGWAVAASAPAGGHPVSLACRPAAGGGVLAVVWLIDR
jgi:membrane-associated phospholipid phosphatase